MSDENINEKEEMLENSEQAEVEEKPAEEAKPYSVVIEEARQDLYKAYGKSRRISNILLFAVVVAICGIMFLIIQNSNVLKIIGYCLAGALVIGMILYYVLTRKTLPNKIKEYVPFVMKTCNEVMFSKEGFEEIKENPEEKLALDDLVGDGVYAEANGINSRNVVRGVYRGHHFLYAEAALMRPAPNKKQQVPPLFVGKYISVPNQMNFEGRFIFTFKNPKQPLDLPNVTDVISLEEKEDFAVYGPENANYHDVIDNKIIAQIRKLAIEGHLLNINVVFWGGHTAVYLSYDDAILSVPFEKPFDAEGFGKSIEDVVTCLAAITEE